MAAGNVIDSFWVALGFKTDTGGLRQFQKEASSVKDSILELGAAIAGIAAGRFALHKVAEIGSTFEQNRIQIAGFFAALGQSTDFNAGLKDAADIMKKINADAARLPGEADDFVEVFKRSFSFVHGAMPGASKEEIADFTNKMTAVGIGWKLDAGIISREFDHMLSPGRGTASLRLPFFAQLLPYMQKVRKDAGFTAEAFNAMSANDRMKLMQETLSTLDPMLSAMGDTWEAMTGAVTSMLKVVTRLGTGGLFQGMKDGLDSITKLLVDDKGDLTENGQAVVDILKFAADIVGRLLRDGVDLVIWFAKLTKESKLFKAVLAGIAAIFVSGTLTSTIGLLGKIAGAFKFGSMAVGLFAVAIALLIEDMYGYYTGARTLIDWSSGLGTALQALIVVVGLLGAAWLAMKVVSVASAIATGIAWAAANIPLLLTLAVIGLLIFGVLELYKHWQDVLDYVQQGLNDWVDTLNRVIEKIDLILAAFGSKGIGKIGAFDFADKHRTAEYNIATTAPGSGIMAPGYGPPTASGADIFGAGYMPAGQGSVVHSETHVDTVNINGNDDPKKMHEGWEREVRDGGHSKVGL